MRKNSLIALDRQYDVYVDASGEDDWGQANSKYYINGIILADPTKPSWKTWESKHTKTFHGAVHFSSGTYGSGGAQCRLPDKKQSCRDLIQGLPWKLALVSIYHKQRVTEHLTNPDRTRPIKYDVSKAIWEMSFNIVISGLLSTINTMDGKPPSSNPIRNVYVNNPKGGDRGRITKKTENELDRTPIFLPGGNPGIDAIDGLMWGIRRIVEMKKLDAVPWKGKATIPGCTYIFGVVNDSPKQLNSIASITEWTNAFP